MSGNINGGNVRVFFALWPDEKVHQALAGLAMEIGPLAQGKAVRTDNLHITLAFIGEVAQLEVERLAELAAAVPCEEFAMSLDRIGYWRHRGIVWLGCRQVPEPLDRLVEQLKRALGRRGYSVDRRKFSPHITLARRAARRPRIKFAPISWPVQRFCLMKSVLSPQGSRYTVMGEWCCGLGHAHCL